MGFASMLKSRLLKDMERGVPEEKALETQDGPSSELSTIYKIYVAWERVAINLVGFFTLFFQCELQAAENQFLDNHPTVTRTQADPMFGHFWLKGDLNCHTREAHCLTYMVTGWLMIAGIL